MFPCVRWSKAAGSSVARLMSGTASERDPGPEQVAEFLHGQGLDAKHYRQIVARLLGGATVEDLILISSLPRRLVERFIGLLGDDVRRRGDLLDLDPTQAAGYQHLAKGAGTGGGFAWVDDDGRVVGEHVRESQGSLSRLTQMLRGRPAPEFHLDQVAAMPETLLRRATLLDARYDLGGRRVAFLGDHDLTSLALMLVNPEVDIVVCDIDDRILEFVARAAERSGAKVEVYFADFRVGLPSTVRGMADLAFIDPPYTPEGVELFAQRSVEALRDADHGRIAIAYGYGGQPGLGLKVQDALGRLRLVYEAVIPAFNRYDGAEAIGRASDLYILRPSSHTAKALDRPSQKTQRMYTKGGQSLESGAAAEDRRQDARALVDVAGAGGLEVVAAIGDWPRGVAARRFGWADVMDASRLPPPLTQEGPVIGDLTHDLGSLLLRALLALNSPRAALLLANQHPDISTAAGQARLRETIGPKYELRFRRSLPSPKLAVLELVAAPDDRLTPGLAVRRYLLSRAHGKVRNVMREALIAVAAASEVKISKSEARLAVADRLPGDTGVTLLDLPRGEIDRHLSVAVDLVDEVLGGSQ
jgi:N4-bis(aminopropyl)spermidine synthase